MGQQQLAHPDACSPSSRNGGEDWKSQRKKHLWVKKKTVISKGCVFCKKQKNQLKGFAHQLPQPAPATQRIICIGKTIHSPSFYCRAQCTGHGITLWVCCVSLLWGHGATGGLGSAQLNQPCITSAVSVSSRGVQHHPGCCEESQLRSSQAQCKYNIGKNLNSVMEMPTGKISKVAESKDETKYFQDFLFIFGMHR